MKKIFLISITIIILIVTDLYSQKENNIWYFGKYVGLDFTSGSPVVIPNNTLSTYYGSSSLCDINGNLICYSDGQYVWNSDHKKITYKNGTSVINDFSMASQSSLIVPQPYSNSNFWVFTAEAPIISNSRGPYDCTTGFFRATKINFDNSTSGQLDTTIDLLNPVIAKMTAVKHRNQRDYWVIAHLWDSDLYLSYLVDTNGINVVPVSTLIGIVEHGDCYAAFGYMKASPDGKTIALAGYTQNIIEILDFDNLTGKIKSVKKLIGDSTYNPVSAYGVEFSPDSRFLYVTCSSGFHTYQFDLNYSDPAEIVSNRYDFKGDSNFAMTLGPDQRIYISQNDSSYLNVIKNPNEKGASCLYTKKGLNLYHNTSNGMGMPNLINAFYNPQKCFGTSFDYPSFSSTNASDFTLIGETSIVDNYISMNKLEQNTANALWYNKKIEVKNGFVSNFSFRITDGNNSGLDDTSLPGGDGIAFVLQNSGLSSIGQNGYGLGYDGISNSLAIEFDMYLNTMVSSNLIQDPDGNHIAIQSNGQGANNASHDISSFNYCKAITKSNNLMTIKNDGTIYYARIEYNLDTHILRIFLDTTLAFQKPVLTLENIDLSSMLNLENGREAFVGFTSSTSQAFQKHEILSWDYCPVDEDISTVDIKETNQITINNDEVSVHPNPFSNITTIKYELENTSKIKLSVYDLTGREVQVLCDEYQFPGQKTFSFNGTGLNQGTYIVVLQNNEKYYSSSAVLIR